MKFFGPYTDGARGTSRVRWTDAEGKGHSKSFPGPTEAKAWLAEQRQNRAPGSKRAPEPSGAPAGSSSWWRDQLTDSAQAIVDAVRDEGADPLQAGRVLSSLAIAAGKHVDTAAIEGRLTQLEEQERQVAAQRKHGPRAGKQAQPTREAPQPGTPIR